MKTLETASTTSELDNVVNQVFADLGITGHESESYGETADCLEKEAAEKYGDGDTCVDDVVEFLRQAEVRWHELEG